MGLSERNGRHNLLCMLTQQLGGLSQLSSDCHTRQLRKRERGSRGKERREREGGRERGREGEGKRERERFTGKRKEGERNKENVFLTFSMRPQSEMNWTSLA